MKPILYEADEENFTTNGLGRLADASRCIVTEERNGSYELEMDYPVDGIHYKDLKEERLIYVPHDDTKIRQPFEIYKITRPMNGMVTVKAKHISYRLSKVTVLPFTATSLSHAMQMLRTRAVNTCDFTFWTDKNSTGEFKVETPQTIRSLLGGKEGSLLDVYGSGEYEWDKKTVKLHNHRGTDSGVTLRYGKNLQDLQKTTDMEEVWAGICPYWQGSDDSSGEVVETVLTIDEGAVYASNAVNTSWRMVIPVDFSSYFETMPTKAQLKSAAQQYANANARTQIPASFDVSFVQLWQTEEYKNIAPLQRLRLCDTVTIWHDGLDVNTTAKIVKTEYDVIQERYSSMTVGDVRGSLARSMVGMEDDLSGMRSSLVKETRTALEIAISHATNLIRGGLGGNVVFNVDANGKPKEILIMDTEDINTAVNVLRINMNGIGFSSTGYNGPFRSAWTLDGSFVADFITAGTLNAALIKTGLLMDEAGENYWNMKTGEFRLASTITVGGKTISEIAEDAAGDSFDDVTAQQLFNKLTNNGQIQGITMSNGNLYINASYINSGTLSGSRLTGQTLTMGGANNGDGVIEVYNASGTQVAGITNAGIVSEGMDGRVPTKSEISGSEMAFYVNNTLTLRIMPFYNSASDTAGETGFGCYKPFYMMPGSGGNVDFRYSGASGNGGFGAPFYFGRNVRINADLKVTGTKDREVTTKNYGSRLLYCYEMPAPIFGDIGDGRTDETGACIIAIDDIFSQTARTDLQYQVFLQKTGEGDLWVEERNQSYFVVKGTPNLGFSWEIKAKQTGYEAERLEDSSLTDENQEILPLETIYEQELENYMTQQEAILYEAA